MHDTCFLKCFRAPSNIAEYDGKTISIVWLEDYILACRVTRVDSGLLLSSSSPFTWPTRPESGTITCIETH
jgi:hypothetical protein